MDRQLSEINHPSGAKCPRFTVPRCATVSGHVLFPDWTRASTRQPCTHLLEKVSTEERRCATVVHVPSHGAQTTAGRRRLRFLRVLVYLGLVVGFLYQASDVVVNYLTYPTTNDVRVEGPEHLEMPAASVCLTNWISKEKLCARQPEFCNYTDTEEDKQRLLRFLDTAGNLGEVAMDSDAILQVVMENPGMSIFPSGFAKQ
ncbi:hypothetical protein V5799_008003 [Amblyomma americanum]|uniref:Uncharacterized protein n=1 Tax=Amblyomma americanum TaxID=6943 RepID=A0AAQ4FFQ5_AMBAM